jgi:CheY-like chemotaxis protein
MGRGSADGDRGFAVFNGLRIALVEDEPGVLKALTLLLEALKCQVTPFNRPTEALSALVERCDVDLILSDLRMPGLSGAEFLKRLRDGGVTTPFILMSGHATNEEVQDARRSGLQEFISKPFTPVQLAQAVTKVIDRDQLVVGE